MIVTLYQLCHYVHVLGSFGICAAMAIEWPILWKLRKAESATGAREWLSLYSGVRWLGGLSLATLLLPGIYMMIAVWHGAGWVQVAFGCVILLGAIGATMTGVKLAQLEQAVSQTNGPLSIDLQRQARRAAFILSWCLRLAIVCSVVALMVLKPALSTSVALVLCGVLIGALAGWIVSRRGGRRSSPNRESSESGPQISLRGRP